MSTRILRTELRLHLNKPALFAIENKNVIGYDIIKKDTDMSYSLSYLYMCDSVSGLVSALWRLCRMLETCQTADEADDPPTPFLSDYLNSCRIWQ